MMDIVDTKTRSRMMSNIREKDTRPELALRRALHARGFRYRLHVRDLPGKPDIVFPKFRAVIFVNGCFWHRHPGCSKATTPATRVEFWKEKFRANVSRDRRNSERLENLGWRVRTIWECELTSSLVDLTAESTAKWLRCGSALL